MKLPGSCLRNTAPVQDVVVFERLTARSLFLMEKSSNVQLYRELYITSLTRYTITHMDKPPYQGF